MEVLKKKIEKNSVRITVSFFHVLHPHVCQSRTLLPVVLPLLLTWYSDLDSWSLFSFPLSLFCPSISESQANSPLVCLPARVVNQALSSPCLSAVPSPLLSARLSQMPRSCKPWLASYLRSARSLLSEPQNIPDFLSFTASPLGSVVGTIVLRSLDVMDFNTKKKSTPNSYLIKEGERKQGYFWLAHPTLL